MKELEPGVVGLPEASVERTCATLSAASVEFTVIHTKINKIDNPRHQLFICLGTSIYLRHRMLLANSRVLVFDTVSHLNHHRIPIMRGNRPTMRQLCATHDDVVQAAAIRHRPKKPIGVKMLERGASSALHKIMTYLYAVRATPKQSKYFFVAIADQRTAQVAALARERGEQEIAEAMEHPDVVRLGQAVNEVGQVLQHGRRVRYARIAKAHKVAAFDLRYLTAKLLKLKQDEVRAA